jgi:hypothetical protein
LTGRAVDNDPEKLHGRRGGNEFVFREGNAESSEDGESFAVVVVSVRGRGDEEGVVRIVRDMGDPVGFANRFDGGGKRFIEGRAWMNAKGNASLVEIVGLVEHPEIVLIVRMHTEKPEGVLHVDLREETRRTDGGDDREDGVESKVLTVRLEEAVIHTRLGTVARVREVMNDAEFVGSLFGHGADGRNLQIGEGGRCEWPRRSAQLDFPLKRLENLEMFDGVVVHVMSLCP